jgi:adenine phosphoribosyltransferase
MDPEPRKHEESREELTAHVAELVKQHDHRGVAFYDIFPVLRDPSGARALFSLMLDHIRKTHAHVDAIVGLEARGFLLAPALALTLEVAFVPLRKAGKLPGDVVGVPYSTEYGTDYLEMQRDSIKPGDVVVLVDDLIGTGGTLCAAHKLAVELGATVAEAVVVIELEKLNGRAKLNDSGVPVWSLLKY